MKPGRRAKIVRILLPKNAVQEALARGTEVLPLVLVGDRIATRSTHSAACHRRRPGRPLPRRA